MMNDAPGHAYLLAAGALENASSLAAPPVTATAEEVEFALVGYLGGVAAAAIVLEAATGQREWTGAQDFAVNGGQVEFLPPEAVLLGTLMLAMTAINRAVDLVPVWEAHPAAPPVPAGHGEVVVQVQRALAQVTQARMTHVSERAEDANE
jgi:hypothetical protein